jgi:hypothetical protein
MIVMEVSHIERVLIFFDESCKLESRPICRLRVSPILDYFCMCGFFHANKIEVFSPPVLFGTVFRMENGLISGVIGIVGVCAEFNAWM